MDLPLSCSVVATLSPDARRLHTFGVLAGIAAGHAGTVSDEYLSAVRAETTMSVLELCAADLWDRVDHGYRVADHETARIAGEVHRQLESLAAACRRSGGHRANPDQPDECGRCGVRLP